MAPDGVTAAPWVAWARFRRRLWEYRGRGLCRRASVGSLATLMSTHSGRGWKWDQDRAREIIFAGLARCPHAIDASHQVCRWRGGSRYDFSAGGRWKTRRNSTRPWASSRRRAAQYLSGTAPCRACIPRQAFYDSGAQRRAAATVQLVFAWAHAEWALGQALNGVSKPVHRGSEAFCLGSSISARRKAPPSRTVGLLRTRQVRAFFGRHDVARRAAARAVRFARRRARPPDRGGRVAGFARSAALLARRLRGPRAQGGCAGRFTDEAGPPARAAVAAPRRAARRDSVLSRRGGDFEEEEGSGMTFLALPFC